VDRSDGDLIIPVFAKLKTSSLTNLSSTLLLHTMKLAIFLLSLGCSQAFFCQGNHNIDTDSGNPPNTVNCGSSKGPVRLVWKVTGNEGFFFNDEVR